MKKTTPTSKKRASSRGAAGSKPAKVLGPQPDPGIHSRQAGRQSGATASTQLRRRNLLTAAAIVVIAAAVAASMFAWRFAHHLQPMPETGGYATPYLPAK